jgi:RimJ/RimL family protein N-acetyltransferase
MVGNKHISRSSENGLNNNWYWGTKLNEAIPDRIDYTKCQCYGIIKEGMPSVAWAFNSFLMHKESNIQELEASVSLAAFRKDWNPLTTIKLILSLFFKDSCYNRLTAVTHASNRQAVRLVKLAGFTLEGILRKPAGIEDIMQFSILREDWEVSRWAILT